MEGVYKQDFRGVNNLVKEQKREEVGSKCDVECGGTQEAMEKCREGKGVREDAGGICSRAWRSKVQSQVRRRQE